MKGQAAYEFLATYVWALLLILATLGALLYLGITQPERFVPNTCDVGLEFACEDFQIVSGTPGSFDAVIRNNLGFSADTQVFAESPRTKEQIPCGAIITMHSGEKLEFSCAFTTTDFILDQREEIRLQVIYTKTGGTRKHTIVGSAKGVTQ